MARIPIQQLLSEDPSRVLVMDGGQGTELEKRGIHIANNVWATTPFIDETFWTNEKSPERHIVTSVYDDFLDAGADILMTITYQASFTSIKENTHISDLDSYNNLMDRIVAFSRKCIGDSKYLIGSIGPWGAHICAEFSGDYGDNAEAIDYLAYFKPQLDNFNNNPEIDVIGFETVPNIHELRAILSWDETIIRKPFYICLSIATEGTLRDGSTFADVAAVLNSLGDNRNTNLFSLGINCCDYNNSLRNLATMHKELGDLPLTVYPNSGEVYDTSTRQWTDSVDKRFAWEDAAVSYIRSGARIIGGCCRTSPHDIRQIVAAVRHILQK